MLMIVITHPPSFGDMTVWRVRHGEMRLINIEHQRASNPSNKKRPLTLLSGAFCVLQSPAIRLGTVSAFKTRNVQSLAQPTATRP